MNIRQQFNLIADEYDVNRKRFIPCFDDFYDGATSFIAKNINKPNTVIDLGAGTGLLTKFWYNNFPDSKYVLVDIAEEMLEVAKKRFVGIDNISYRITDYISSLPSDDFDTVISALSIHHLEDEDKVKLFSMIYDRLPKGGIFVNYDQFNADSAVMSSWFDSCWVSSLKGSGLSDKDIMLWKERRKLDRECSIRQEIEMLSSCGFGAAECIYANCKFAVVAAIK
ncbi:MAG: class I SAM-dependent methyltransferase [Clostridia bacterium]|nr:class I SAM-dependent methyltransferase [Clostridia bacterium]